MKSIFTDLYNKILEIFQLEKSENTANCAVDRLQVILMHDRTKLDPFIMNKMREELIDVFSKYVVIDKERLEIDLTNEGDAAALMLNIPILRAKTEEELNEIRKQIQEEENKKSDSDEDDDEDSDDETQDENEEDDDVIVEEVTDEDEDKDTANISDDDNNDQTTSEEIVEE